MPSQVVMEGASMLRFLTPTEPWMERVPSKASFPGEWPLMLVEILHTEEGHLMMTCALGVPRSSLKAFLAQGAYLYQFRELQDTIVEILDAHFARVQNDLALRVESLTLPEKPRLILIKKS